MKKSNVLVLLTASLLGSSLPSAQAVLLVHESFQTGSDPNLGQYSTSSSLIGQGPTVTGFTGNWLTGTTGPANPIATGLSFTGVSSSGGAASIGTNNVRTGRLLSTPFTASTTGTFYLSFMIELGGVDNQYKAFELHNGGFADSNRNFRLGNGGGSGGFSATNYAFRIGNGTAQDLGTADTNTNFFVVRFDLSSTAASDTVTVYRNPVDLAIESNNTGVTLTGQDIVFDRITLAQFTTQQVSFDEIRIGTTFGDVTTVPEPSTYIMVVGGLSLLYLLRRRRQ